MAAEYVSLESDAPDPAPIRRAAGALAEGALVIFPTETVYGLAASAAVDGAIERLRAIKGRNATQPFTVHLGRASECEDYVPEVGSLGRRLMRKAWPGPLTLVFKVEDPASTRAHGRLSEQGAAAIYAERSVGLRVPDHPVAEHLLREAGVPVVATSANVTGAPAPVAAGEVSAELTERADFILDAGPTRYRKGSTVVACNGDGYRLLRAGVWDERTIRRLSRVQILFVCTGNTCRSPIAEGLLKKMLAEKLGCAIEALPEKGVVVQSAGTLGHTGARVSDESVAVCQARGVDISDHRSRGLAVELIHPADHIYGMAEHHLDVIRAMAPSDAGKAELLDPEGDIADPIGGTQEDYERVARRIGEALQKRLEEVIV